MKRALQSLQDDSSRSKLNNSFTNISFKKGPDCAAPVRSIDDTDVALEMLSDITGLRQSDLVASSPLRRGKTAASAPANPPVSSTFVPMDDLDDLDDTDLLAEMEKLGFDLSGTNANAASPAPADLPSPVRAPAPAAAPTSVPVPVQDGIDDDLEVVEIKLAPAMAADDLDELNSLFNSMIDAVPVVAKPAPAAVVAAPVVAKPAPMVAAAPSPVAAPVGLSALDDLDDLVSLSSFASTAAPAVTSTPSSSSVAVLDLDDVATESSSVIQQLKSQATMSALDEEDELDMLLVSHERAAADDGVRSVLDEMAGLASKVPATAAATAVGAPLHSGDSLEALFSSVQSSTPVAPARSQIADLGSELDAVANEAVWETNPLTKDARPFKVIRDGDEDDDDEEPFDPEMMEFPPGISNEERVRLTAKAMVEHKKKQRQRKMERLQLRKREEAIARLKAEKLTRMAALNIPTSGARPAEPPAPKVTAEPAASTAQNPAAPDPALLAIASAAGPESDFGAFVAAVAALQAPDGTLLSPEAVSEHLRKKATQAKDVAMMFTDTQIGLQKQVLHIVRDTLMAAQPFVAALHSLAAAARSGGGASLDGVFRACLQPRRAAIDQFKVLCAAVDKVLPAADQLRGSSREAVILRAVTDAQDALFPNLDGSYLQANVQIPKTPPPEGGSWSVPLLIRHFTQEDLKQIQTLVGFVNSPALTAGNFDYGGFVQMNLARCPNVAALKKLVSTMRSLFPGSADTVLSQQSVLHLKSVGKLIETVSLNERKGVFLYTPALVQARKDYLDVVKVQLESLKEILGIVTKVISQQQQPLSR
jgi:hypothetical protein